MEIILLEHIAKLGKMGDKVNVKNGYARNYLLPQKKALRATDANVAYFEKQRAELEAHNKALFDEANKKAEQLKGFSAVVVRQAAETGQLYGSVTIRDIAAAVNEAGVALERRYVVLDKPIKYLGVYPVVLSLHPEVSQTILVNVARSQDEAKKQAKAYSNEGKEAEVAPKAEEKPAEKAKEEPKAEEKPAEKKEPAKKAESKKESKPAEKKAPAKKESKPAEKKAPAKKAEAKPAAEKKEAAKSSKAPVERKEGAPRSYHITQHPNGGWQVKGAGSAKALKLFPTQLEAIKYARELEKTTGVSFRVHSMSGKIRKA